MSTQLSPQIVAQAADWFWRFRTGAVPLSEREEFLRWLRQSPRHVKAYFGEACRYSDIDALAACDGPVNRVDEPCSTARVQGSHDGPRPRSHKQR